MGAVSACDVARVAVSRVRDGMLGARSHGRRVGGSELRNAAHDAASAHERQW